MYIQCILQFHKILENKTVGIIEKKSVTAKGVG